MKKKRVRVPQSVRIKSKLMLAQKNYDDLIEELINRGFRCARSTISRTINGVTRNDDLLEQIQIILKEWGV